MQARKTRVINFRLSEEDLEHIQHAASHGGESVCEYARRAVFLRSGLGAQIAQPTPQTLAQGHRLDHGRVHSVTLSGDKLSGAATPVVNAAGNA